MTRRISWLVALAALVALALAPSGVAGTKKGYKLSRGATTITLNTDTAAALTGITITPFNKAKGSQATGAFKFPVTTGRVLADTSGDTPTVKAATIKHVGGLRLSKDDKKVAIRNFWVSISDKGAKVTAQLVGGKRFDLATIEGGSAPEFSGKNNRTVTVKGVTLKLTKVAADALVATFGLDATQVTEGTELGTADITTRLIGKGPIAKHPKPVKPTKSAPKPHKH
jgi:hypothetical protein